MTNNLKRVASREYLLALQNGSVKIPYTPKLEYGITGAQLYGIFNFRITSQPGVTCPKNNQKNKIINAKIMCITS